MTSLIEILGNLVPQAPVILVCAAACVMVLMRAPRNSRAAILALAGFGLALAMCFAVPLTQTLVRQWATASGGDSAASRAWAFTAHAFFWSLLRAATYVFLLLAVLAHRAPESPDAGRRETSN